VRRAFAAAVAVLPLLGAAVVRGAAAQDASPTPPAVAGASPSPITAAPAASPKPKASPQPAAAPAATRLKAADVPSPEAVPTRRPKAVGPKPTRAARRPARRRTPTAAPVPLPRLVRRDLGISFVSPAGYKAVPADRLGAGLAYACTGPNDGGVAATVHLLVQPAPPGEVPPGFAATLAEKLEAAFPPAAELRVVSQGETRVAGVRAAVLSAALSVRGRRLRNCQTTFSRGGRRYLFTFTASEDAFGDRVKAFFGLVESVRWTE